MPLFGSRSELDDIPGELAKLAKIGPTLGSAIERFRRQIKKTVSRKASGQTRAGRPRTPLPSAPARRPVARHLVVRRHLRTRPRQAMLRRPQTHDAQPRARQSRIGAAAQRVAGAIRDRLLALRNGLARLRNRLAGRAPAIGRIRRRI
jgi:hypothetical protein